MLSGIFSDAVALGISTNAVFFGGKRRKHLKLRIHLQRKCFSPGLLNAQSSASMFVITDRTEFELEAGAASSNSEADNVKLIGPLLPVSPFVSE